MRKLTINTTRISNTQIQEELKIFYQNPIAQVSTQLLATIALVVFFAVFAIRPTILTMTQLSKDISEKQEIDKKLTQKSAALSTLSTEYNKMKSDIPILNTSIPSTPDFDGTLRRIEKVASENNIIFSSLRSKKIPEDNLELSAQPSINSFPITFSAKGTFLDLKKFFDTILTMDRLVVLENVSFTTSDTEESVFLTGTMNIYYFGAAQQESN